jgi:ArsR family transcriptional regulator
MRVLDLGCGAGLDTLIAARRVGRDGRVVGVDFSEPMLARARRAASEARCEWVAFCRATAGRLPLADGAVDVALVNGLFNLNPERAAIFRELARVVRRGGAVYAAELILTAPLPAEQRNEASWFA